MAVLAPSQPHLRHGNLVLLILLTALATAWACHHPHPLDTTFPWDSLQLLQTMAPSPTQPCQQQQVHTIPNTLLHNSHPQQAATITLRILQHLFTIFSSPRTPQHWNPQAQHGFLNNLHHHIHHLERCLPANGMLSKRKMPHNLQFSIDKYFRRIQDFLHTHNYGTCAWDHIRLQAHACLQYMDTFIRRMKSQETSALHQTDPHQTSIAHQHPQRKRQHQQPHLGLLRIAHTFSQEAIPTQKWT